MKVLVTGGDGQLGRAFARTGRPTVTLCRAQLDITVPAQIAEALAAHRPDLVVNAAAFTAVDRAETERDAAFAVNAIGAANVARACAAARCPLIHVSTDHVFAGTASKPYRETDDVAPVNTYGASKLAGERAVLAEGGVVVRTAWLFGAGGGSFVHAIARAARTHSTVRVVDDQYGSPTCADDLATAVRLLAAHEPSGVYHAVGAEPMSRYTFAAAIVRAAGMRCEVIPTTTGDAPARRPAYAVLATERLAALGITLPSWRRGLAAIAGEL